MFEDSPRQIELRMRPIEPSSRLQQVLLFEPSSRFRKRTLASQHRGRSSLGCAVSAMLVFWTDMSLSHQSGISGPPGAAVKCQREPPAEWCQPCVGLHHQILKRFGLITVLPPTETPVVYPLFVPLKKCYIQINGLLWFRHIEAIEASSILWISNSCWSFGNIQDLFI